MLELYKSYTRKDVQELLCPDDKYTAGAGKWGLSGIVCLNKNDNDFVLFVNLHPNRSKCNFDEKTKSGNFYIKNGSLEDICVLKPTNYLCELK